MEGTGRLSLEDASLRVLPADTVAKVRSLLRSRFGENAEGERTIEALLCESVSPAQFRSFVQHHSNAFDDIMLDALIAMVDWAEEEDVEDAGDVAVASVSAHGSQADEMDGFDDLDDLADFTVAEEIAATPAGSGDAGSASAVEAEMQVPMPVQSPALVVTRPGATLGPSRASAIALPTASSFSPGSTGAPARLANRAASSASPSAPLSPLSHSHANASTVRAVRRGLLYKKGAGSRTAGRHNWKLRLFDIQDDTLSYYAPGVQLPESAMPANGSDDDGAGSCGDADVFNMDAHNGAYDDTGTTRTSMAQPRLSFKFASRGKSDRAPAAAKIKAKAKAKAKAKSQPYPPQRASSG